MVLAHRKCRTAFFIGLILQFVSLAAQGQSTTRDLFSLPPVGSGPVIQTGTSQSSPASDVSRNSIFHPPSFDATAEPLANSPSQLTLDGANGEPAADTPAAPQEMAPVDVSAKVSRSKNESWNPSGYSQEDAYSDASALWTRHTAGNRLDQFPTEMLQAAQVQAESACANSVPMRSVPMHSVPTVPMATLPTGLAVGSPSIRYAAPRVAGPVQHQGVRPVGNHLFGRHSGGRSGSLTAPLDGCGPCCGQMQCTTAACGNRKCDGLCGARCGQPRWWAQIDTLLWYLEGYSTPALLTRSPAGTPQNVAGVLGNNSTRLLFGEEDFGDELRVGGRLQAGWWFDTCRKVGIQADFFALGGGGETNIFTGNGVDTFARPFFNTDAAVNAEDAQIFSRPGLADGSVSFATSSEVISGGPSLRWNLSCCEGTDQHCKPRSRRVDFLLGYRYFRLQEEFAAREVLNPTDASFPQGTRFELYDRIETENNFHGVEFGLNHLYQRGSWTWDIATLFAVGEVQRSVELDGSTRITVPGVSDTTMPGGFYVGPLGIGRWEDRDYAIIPQVRANLSYCLGCNWRLGVGYSFMYLNSAFRPDTFIDTAFDGSRLASPAPIGVVNEQPFTPRQDLFLHGANVGVTYNF